MSRKPRPTKAVTQPEPTTATPEQREAEVILGRLAALGVNVPHLMGQVVPRAQVAALLDVLVDAGVITGQQFEAAMVPRMAAEMRGALAQIQRQMREQAEENVERQRRVAAGVQVARTRLVLPGRN